VLFPHSKAITSLRFSALSLHLKLKTAPGGALPDLPLESLIDFALAVLKELEVKDNSLCKQ